MYVVSELACVCADHTVLRAFDMYASYLLSRRIDIVGAVPFSFHRSLHNPNSVLPPVPRFAKRPTASTSPVRTVALHFNPVA